jgi:hypothetical protein
MNLAIDEHASSPTTTAPVFLLLLEEKTEKMIVGDDRALGKNVVLRFGGKIYTYAGDDQRGGRWVRLFRIAAVVDLAAPVG